jgi:uncharacterized membrane protein YfcA
MLLLRLGAGIGHAVSLPALAAVGLVVGYFAGMFGVGGGFLLTPMLIYVFGVPPPVAVGSALCQKCGTSIGVDAGTRLLAYLSGLGNWQCGRGHAVPAVQVVLDVLFIVLLSFTAFYTFRDAWQARHRSVPRGDTTIAGPLVTKVHIPPFIDLPRVQLRQVSVPMLSYLGFGLGLASGLMGIGGGVLFLPILLYGIGLSVKNAAGTGVLLLFVTVAVGTIEQALRGYVSLKLGMAVLVGSSVGAQMGALTTYYLPNRILRLLFAVLVAFTVLMISWDLLRLVR